MVGMDTTEEHTVGSVAALTGVSVRMLHHYDQIGLLVPSRRSLGGYRLYSDADLHRLQRILYYRLIDVDLDTIARLLSDDTVAVEDELRGHRTALTERVERYQALVRAIDRELAARSLGITLTARERLEVFGSTTLEDNAARAVDKWAGTDSWDQRRERVAGYTQQDWMALRHEQASIHQSLLEAMESGRRPNDPAVMDLAESHRQHVNNWFHDCDYDLHRQMAATFLADQRIGRNFDDMAKGLSRYVHDAIIANAERADRKRAST